MAKRVKKIILWTRFAGRNLRYAQSPNSTSAAHFKRPKTKELKMAKRKKVVHPTIKYCPNCKGDLTSVPERLLFRCSTCRRHWKVDEFSVDECKRCGTWKILAIQATLATMGG
jgi:hypothetical protein